MQVVLSTQRQVMEEQREKIINHLPLRQARGWGKGLFLLHLRSRLQLSCVGIFSRSSLWRTEFHWVCRAVCTLLPQLWHRTQPPPIITVPMCSKDGEVGKRENAKPPNFDRGISLNIVSFRNTLKITAQE